MKETLRIWYNRARIWFLEHFTTRVQRIEIKDKDGKKHDVIVEKEIEKVCDHKSISEIAPTMWKCNGCNEVYFQIGYKVMLTDQDLVKYLDQLASHLKMRLEEHA